MSDNLDQTFFNYMVYWDYSEKGPTSEALSLLKLQVENSLQLGWEPKNIKVVTNFSFRYLNIEAMKIDLTIPNCRKNTWAKIFVTEHLIKKGIIKKNSIWWFHDLDCVQLIPFNVPPEKKQKGKYIAFATSSWQNKISTASFFFCSESLFMWQKLIKRGKELNLEKCHNEEVVGRPLFRRDPSLSKHIIQVSCAYQYTAKRIDQHWSEIEKPLKVIHFHPTSVKSQRKILGGENFTGKSLVPKRVQDLYKKYFN